VTETDEQTLNQISRKLDLILGVLLTRGKSSEEALQILNDFEFDSTTMAKLARVTPGYVRTWKSRKRRKAQRPSS
jgi:hypothetical protein